MSDFLDSWTLAPQEPESQSEYIRAHKDRPGRIGDTAGCHREENVRNQLLFFPEDRGMLMNPAIEMYIYVYILILIIVIYVLSYLMYSYFKDSCC